MSGRAKYCRKRASNANTLVQISQPHKAHYKQRVEGKQQPSQLVQAYCEASAAVTPHSFYTTFDIIPASLTAVLPLQKLRVCTCARRVATMIPKEKEKRPGFGKSRDS